MPSTKTLRLAPVDVLQSRVITVSSNLAHLHADLTLYDGNSRPTVDVTGSSLIRTALRTDGGFSFDVGDTQSLRALGEALIVLSERGESTGMLAPRCAAGAA